MFPVISSLCLCFFLASHESDSFPTMYVLTGALEPHTQYFFSFLFRTPGEHLFKLVSEIPGVGGLWGIVR